MTHLFTLHPIHDDESEVRVVDVFVELDGPAEMFGAEGTADALEDLVA